jgi:hypothetical protein
VVAVLAVLFDIRRELTRFVSSSRETMAKKKKKADGIHWARKRTDEELKNDPTMLLLQERIAYHKAKIEEERAAKRAS